MFTSTKNACGNGRKPFKAAYKDAVDSRLVNLAEKCQERTGEEYITVRRLGNQGLFFFFSYAFLYGSSLSYINPWEIILLEHVPKV